jgi:pyruvate dehydrogenase E2 component (dihydrolipoamide acetyltransferase)
VAQVMKLPEMGEGIESGTVVRVMVSEGDTVAKNQGLVELETDKALIEVPSDFAGTVSKVHVKTGDKVQVGAELVSIGEGAAAAESGAQNGAAKAADPGKQATGKTQQVDAPAGEPQAASASATAKAAKADAAAAEQDNAASGDQQTNDKPIAAGSNGSDTGSSGNGAKRPAPQRESSPAATNGAGPEIIPAGPSTRRYARELGVDLRSVGGTGPSGRITQDDVKAHVNAAMSGGGGVSAMRTPDLPDFAKWGEVERTPMSQVRRLTAEHMARSWAIVPHVTQYEKIDVTELEAFRKRHEARIEKQGGKLTLTVLIIKAVVSCLKQYPNFNASLDLGSGEIVYKRYYNIGIAVDTERGLLVPNIKDAGGKDLVQLSSDLTEMADKTRTGHIELSALSGGTFTISNQGGIGGAEFSPIVNWPEVAILGVGRGRMEPGYAPGEKDFDDLLPMARLMMPVGLSYDHRVIDGAMAARFIRTLKETLEDPELLLLGV